MQTLRLRLWPSPLCAAPHPAASRHQLVEPWTPQSGTPLASSPRLLPSRRFRLAELQHPPAPSALQLLMLVQTPPALLPSGPQLQPPVQPLPPRPVRTLLLLLFQSPLSSAPHPSVPRHQLAEPRTPQSQRPPALPPRLPASYPFRLVGLQPPPSLSALQLLVLVQIPPELAPPQPQLQHLAWPSPWMPPLQWMSPRPLPAPLPWVRPRLVCSPSCSASKRSGRGLLPNQMQEASGSQQQRAL
mmetsp:Transcript_17832/g.46107  ORF Transcript_17832/g.46107 Transcript_17832/m.46107 type:complete len:243 (+) Transcript_17832:1136-1864(+)